MSVCVLSLGNLKKSLKLALYMYLKKKDNIPNGKEAIGGFHVTSRRPCWCTPTEEF